MKKIVAILFMLVFVLSFSLSPVRAVADTENRLGIIPMYTNVHQIAAVISFSETTASCYGTVIGISGTTYISSSLTLEQVNPNNTTSFIASWSNSSASNFLEIKGSKSVTKGYTYRLTHTTSVIKNGTSETVTVFTEKKCE